MKLMVLTIAGSALALVATAVLILSLRPHSAGPTQLAEYRRQMQSEEPNRRLEAATALLSADATDEEALVTKAAALVELDRFSEARKTLEVLLHRGSAPVTRALLLEAESYLEEAANLVAGGNATTVDLTYARVRELFNDLDSTRQLLAHDKSADRAVLMILARQADLSATLARQAAKPLVAELTQSRDSRSDVDVQSVDPIVSDLVARRRQLEAAVERFGRQAILLDPTAADAYLLLVQMWLRTGRFDKAREEADRVAQLPRLERSTAGRIAGLLLNLEETYGQPVLPADVELCARLLGHKSLTGRHSADFVLASADLALRQGRPEEADRLAAPLLENSPNVRASCLRGRALIAQHKPEKAVELLLPVTEQTRSGLAWEALGVAYFACAKARLAEGQKELADDQVRQGRVILRQTLDLAPDLLPARLALAQSLTSAGNVDQAQADIVAAARINPIHPQVLALQTQLLVERTDVAGLTAMIGAASQDGTAWRWQTDDIALAGFMTLDDAASVAQAVETGLNEVQPGAMALIGNAWLGAEPWKRRLVAMAVTQTLLERLDADPMQRPLAPELPGSGVGASSDPKTTSAAADLQPLTQPRFIPWPEETALELAESALELWPDHSALLEQACVFNLMLGRPGQAATWIDRIPSPSLTPLRQALTAYAHGDHEGARKYLSGTANRGKSPARLWLELAVALDAGDRAAAQRQLKQALADHPWFEQAILLFLRDAVKHSDIDQARTALQNLGNDGQAMIMICAGRLDLALRSPLDALNHAAAAELLLPEELSRRWFLAEVRACANLALQRKQPAQDIFAGLAATWPQQRVNIYWHWADLLCDSEQTRRAADILAAPLADPTTTSRQMDFLLVRCAMLMSGERLGALLDDLLKTRKEQSLLLLYRARAYEKEGDVAAAESTVDRVLHLQPQAARALMAKAHLARLQDRTAEALAIYEQLMRRGGRASLAAGTEREKLQPPQAAIGSAGGNQ